MNYKMKRIILSVMLVVALLSLLVVGACKDTTVPTTPTTPTTPATTPATPTTPTDAPAEAEVFKWKLVYYAPPQDVYEHMAVDFCDQLREMSGGRLDITPYPEGAIVPAAEMLGAVEKVAYVNIPHQR